MMTATEGVASGAASEQGPAGMEMTKISWARWGTICKCLPGRAGGYFPIWWLLEQPKPLSKRAPVMCKANYFNGWKKILIVYYSLLIHLP